MAKLFANSGDSDQTPQFTASDMSPHCLPVTRLGSPDLNGFRGTRSLASFNCQLEIPLAT